jgi:hypothetical protein
MALDRQTKRALNALQEQVQALVTPAEPAVLIEGPALATAEDLARVEAKLDQALELLGSLTAGRTFTKR